MALRTFDILREYQESMTHYLLLAKSEGWKQDVWQRVQEIDEMPGFAGFKDEFLKQVKDVE